MTAKLISRRTDQLDEDDEKVVSLPSTQHRWTISYNNNDNASACKEDEARHKEELPFSERDLVQYFCDDGEEYFYMQITIRTEFRRHPDTQSRYNGILGAILLQSETEMENQRASNTSERNREQQSPLQIDYLLQHSLPAQQTGKELSPWKRGTESQTAEHSVEVARRIHNSFTKHITKNKKNQNQFAKCTVAALWRWIEEHGISALDENDKIQKEYAQLTQSFDQLENMKNLLQKELDLRRLNADNLKKKLEEITKNLNEERKYTRELMDTIRDLQESNDSDNPQEINAAEDNEQSQDDQKQFAFDYEEEAPVADEYGDKFSATNWENTFGGEGDTVNEESNSFVNINWNLDGNATISTFDTNTGAVTQQPAGDTSADTNNTNNAANNNDDDNMAECPFKPTVQLEEQHAATGNETISFGVDNTNEDGQDSSNVTTRGGHAAEDNSANSSESNSKDEKPQEKEKAGQWSFNVFGIETDNGGGGGWGDIATSRNLGGDSGDKADASANDENEANADGWGDVGGGFSSVKPTEGWANAGWGNDKSGRWGSFESTNFNLESMETAEQPVDAVQANESETKTVATQNGGKADDEDNMVECTFKPIVQLEEVNVAAGTEGDIMLDSFEIVKLYRWGKDVTGDAGWKDRASNTTIDIWQQPNKGKVWVICRESVTSKLRLNHWLPASNVAKALLRAEKFVQWSGFDTTVHAEDEEDSNGCCMFICKFRDGETAQKFYDLLMESIENNEKLVANAEQ